MQEFKIEKTESSLPANSVFHFVIDCLRARSYGSTPKQIKK